MVCKKDVVTWFKNLKSHKRVDVMCSLLQLCVPFELRFLGTCLEDLAKRDYQDLRQTETEANSLSELNSPEVQSLTNQETRTKLALYVSLLHSCNDACSNKIFKILTKDDINSVLNLAMTDNLVLEELLSIYTLVLNHPAFSFDQKISIDKIFSKLQDEESRLCDQNMKNKQSNFSHSAISDSIHERIPQPIQSYQPCVDDSHQPCYTVTNAVGPCPPIPASLHHPHPNNKPYMPYGGESSDERRLGGGWSGGLSCDNGSSVVVRPSSLSAPPCDPTSSPMMGIRGAALPPGCDQPVSRVPAMAPPCDPSGSPLMGSRMANPSDTAGPVPRVANPSLPCDPPPSGSPLVSRNNSPCQSPSRPSTPPRHRLTQNQPPSHSPPPRQINHKDQTKDVPVPNVPIDQLSRMNDEELREVGLPQNAILQLRSLNKHVSNGLPPPPPPPLMDYRKKPEMMIRSVEGYPGGGVCMSPAMPCCFSVPPRPKYGPIPPQVYPALESLGVIRLDQESNSSASDTASDHSPPDTPGPQDPVAGRRIHNQPPPRRPNNTGPHHNHLNQGVIYRRRDGGGMVNGCDDRKVYSNDGPGSYYSQQGAGPPAWPHQYMRPSYPPAPHFPHFVPTQHRPHPQPFPFNGELMYPYTYQPYPPTTHLQVTKVSCYNCGSPSHAPVECPELTMEEITNQGQYKIDYSKTGGSVPGGPQITSSASPSELPPPNTDK